MRKLKLHLKQKLLANAPVLEALLEQAIIDSEVEESGYFNDQQASWKVEKYFDQRLIQEIRVSTNGIHTTLNQNIINRLNRVFWRPTTTKFINIHYNTCLEILLQDLRNKSGLSTSIKTGLIPFFQKKWDAILLQFIQSNPTNIEKTYATNYYFEYLEGLPIIQKRQKKLRLDFPNLSDDTYTIPFQEAFTNFIKKIEAKGFVFQENANAFFIVIFTRRLTDFVRKEIKKKEKVDPAKPTNIDITNPSEIEYLKVEIKIPPYKPAYLPYFPIALKMMGDKCRKVLKLYFFEKQSITEIAEDEGIKKQSIHERLHKCSTKFGILLEKLKRQNG